MSVFLSCPAFCARTGLIFALNESDLTGFPFSGLRLIATTKLRRGYKKCEPAAALLKLHAG
jgi:hypothetical protein